MVYRNDHLEHHGILGMKWGIRRYQNKDGSLTPAGKKRYDAGEKIKGFDKQAYYKYDREANPNKYGRLTDEQKKKYNYEKQLDLLEKIDKRAEDFSNNEKLWNKYATEVASKSYDEDKGHKLEEWYKTKENYIKAFLDRDDNDGVAVWEYYAANDPKTKALRDKGKKWIDNVVKNELKTGVTVGDIYTQMYDDIDRRYLDKS